MKCSWSSEVDTIFHKCRFSWAQKRQHAFFFPGKLCNPFLRKFHILCPGSASWDILWGSYCCIIALHIPLIQVIRWCSFCWTSSSSLDLSSHSDPSWPCQSSMKETSLPVRYYCRFFLDYWWDDDDSCGPATAERRAQGRPCIRIRGDYLYLCVTYML